MVGKYHFVCFYTSFLLDPLNHWSTYFLEEKGYVVGTLRMLHWDNNRFLPQILRIMLLTCNQSIYAVSDPLPGFGSLGYRGFSVPLSWKGTWISISLK